MNTAIAEFNLLYPRFEAHSFNTQCEVVETNPKTPATFIGSLLRTSVDTSSRASWQRQPSRFTIRQAVPTR